MRTSRRALRWAIAIAWVMTAVVPVPATFASQVATPPVIVGQVVAVHDHRIVVDTVQGQRVALEIDSRTIVPRNLASDMTVRIDYRAMAGGPGYAKRIALTMSHANTRPDSHIAPADRQEGPTQIAALEAQRVPSEALETPPATRWGNERLPQTAGVQPLTALLGCLALGTSMVLAIGRQRRGRILTRDMYPPASSACPPGGTGPGTSAHDARRRPESHA